MRYRDLPAVHFTPPAYAKLEIPDGAKIGDISISPDGELIWSSFSPDRTSSIFAENGTPVPLRPPEARAFVLPLVQRFLDGRWLVVEARTEPDKRNAFLFGSDAQFLRSFYLGDGIRTVLVDQRDKIWVGYFDEGIFGAFSPMPPENHQSYRYGPSGLLRCDDQGRVEFSYNSQHPDKPISDIYALTLDADGKAWFCAYTDFFLASVSENQVDYVLPKAPVTMADAISVGPEYVAFFGGYKQSSMVTVMHRASQRLRLIQLHRQDGATLSPTRFAARGAQVIAVADDHLFKLDQRSLLDALGPWTEANSSDVSSAVQYHDEEESYSDSYLIFGQGAGKVPGKRRPPENQPRKDEDSER